MKTHLVPCKRGDSIATFYGEQDARCFRKDAKTYRSAVAMLKEERKLCMECEDCLTLPRKR